MVLSKKNKEIIRNIIVGFAIALSALFITQWMMQFASAAVPFQTSQSDTAWEIRTELIEAHKLATAHTFNARVFNSSNGVPINKNLSCLFSLYDSEGNKIVDITDDTPTGYDYTFLVGENNFTIPELYSYVISCNSSLTNQGGFIGESFEVNRTGTILSISQAVLYILTAFSVLFLFLISAVGALKIPWNNYRGPDSYVIGINWYKYIKLALIVFSYIFLLGTLWVSYQIGNGFLNFGVGGKIIEVSFYVLMALFYPILVVASLVAFITIVFDSKIHSQLARGLHIK